jgi:hypothetical protein
LKLVGFGCSFTYGSELQSPDIDPTDHWANTRYRNENVWLGQIAKRFDCEYDNLAEPANSNMAIAQQVANYFLHTRDPQEHIVICVAWTERTRFSWFDESWTHNGFVKEDWSVSCKEWVIKSTSTSHDMWTNNAKLMVNSICKAYDVPILQFNALGKHSLKKYDNYFINGSCMDSTLKRAEQEDNRLNLFASGGHPNEAGHEYFTKRLYLFAKERIII